MSTWAYFELATGRLTGATTGSSEAEFRPVAPEGLGVLEVGGRDLKLQRVDLATGVLVVDELAAQGPAIDTRALDARLRRDSMLRESDWTQLLDAPLDDETRKAWAAYRGELRALAETPGFPDAITWPSAPVQAAATTESP